MQAPPVPEFASTEARLKYLRWLGTMSERLKKKKPELEVRKASFCKPCGTRASAPGWMWTWCWA
jgi:hypothetical protein